MVKLEELPNDFDETTNPKDGVTWTAEDEGLYREMYRDPVSKNMPREEPSNDRSFDEVMSELSQTPIFMDNLDVAGGAGRTGMAQSGQD